jgi:hypothetical protein
MRLLCAFVVIFSSSATGSESGINGVWVLDHGKSKFSGKNAHHGLVMQLQTLEPGQLSVWQISRQSSAQRLEHRQYTVLKGGDESVATFQKLILRDQATDALEEWVFWPDGKLIVNRPKDTTFGLKQERLMLRRAHQHALVHISSKKIGDSMPKMLLASAFVGTVFATVKVTTPTYYRDVVPILQAHCLSCHRPGQIAPMAFTSFRKTQPWAEMIKQVVVTAKMPPWLGGQPSSFGQDHALSQTEVEILVEWVEGGALEGDRRDAPPPVYPEEARVRGDAPRSMRP